MDACARDLLRIDKANSKDDVVGPVLDLLEPLQQELCSSLSYLRQDQQRECSYLRVSQVGGFTNWGYEQWPFR